MPNIKSAEKRVRIIEKKTNENKAVKTKVRTFIKKFKTCIENKEVENAQKAYVEVVSVMDKAVSDGVIHKNSSNRKKPTLQNFLTNLNHKQIKIKSSLEK